MVKGNTEITTIPRLRQVFYDVYADLPVIGVAVGDLSYATDRKTFYRWDGAAWQPVTVYMGTGAAADIPAAADVPEGSTYYATDTFILYMQSGGAWVAMPATQIATGSYTGNGGAARQITVGFKCSMVIIQCQAGGVILRWLLIPNFTVNDEGNVSGAGGNEVLFDDTANCYLHATDGFVVDNADSNRMNQGSNKNLIVFYYWAISE